MNDYFYSFEFAVWRGWVDLPIERTPAMRELLTVTEALAVEDNQ